MTFSLQSLKTKSTIWIINAHISSESEQKHRHLSNFALEVEGPQKAISVKIMHQSIANDHQNCGLWIN